MGNAIQKFDEFYNGPSGKVHIETNRRDVVQALVRFGWQLTGEEPLFG